MFFLMSWSVFVVVNGLNISTTPPETPLPPTAIDIGYTHIALEWFHPSSISTITECALKANTVTIYRGIKTEFNYTQLQAGSVYIFQLICENLCCWSAYASAVTYTTLTVPHFCDTNADFIWDELWSSSADINTNLYTHFDENEDICILSHDGQTNPRYQIDEFCTSDCAMEEATDYLQYIKKTGIRLIATKSSTEAYVISANANYKDNDISPINVMPILSSEDLDNLCFNHSFNDTMGLLWYTQVHWPLGGFANYQSNLQRFYDNGLRIFMITYGSGSNQGSDERLGSGTDEVGGLTEFGRAVVHALNMMGFIIDCSHCNNQTTVETALLSTTPIIANHANVYQVSQSTRTMINDSIEAIVDKGGVIGIMPLKRFITAKSSATIDDVLQHIDYLVVNYGEDYVGVSTDWFVDNIHYYSAYDYIDTYINSWKRWKYVACFLSIQPYNYSYARMRKIMGGNFQRVYRGILDETDPYVYYTEPTHDLTENPTKVPSVQPSEYESTQPNESPTENLTVDAIKDPTEEPSDAWRKHDRKNHKKPCGNIGKVEGYNSNKWWDKKGRKNKNKAIKQWNHADYSDYNQWRDIDSHWKSHWRSFWEEKGCNRDNENKWWKEHKHDK